MLLCHVIRRLGNIRFQLLTFLQQRGYVGVSAHAIILRGINGLNQLLSLLDQRAAPFGFVEQNTVYCLRCSQKVRCWIRVFLQVHGQHRPFNLCGHNVTSAQLLCQCLRNKVNCRAIDMLKRIPLHGQSYILLRQSGSDEQRHSLENAGAAVCLD